MRRAGRLSGRVGQQAFCTRSTASSVAGRDRRSVNMLQDTRRAGQYFRQRVFMVMSRPSLRMGNTQYDEVPTEYAFLLVEN